MRCIEDTLQRWHEWVVPWSSPPRVVRELSGGSTNQTFLITADNRSWVLRLNADSLDGVGFDREREAAIVECAAAAGIAPAVVYWSIEQGILVTEFIDGQHWNAREIDNPEHQTRLLQLIQSVHALDIETKPMDYYAHAERYWEALAARKIDVPLTLYHERELLLEQRELHPERTQISCLCHHDLSPSNIVERDGRLYLLDWEYAMRGSRVFDYAGLATEWEIPLDRLQQLVNIELAEISEAKRLYQYICRLWSLLHAGR